MLVLSAHDIFHLHHCITAKIINYDKYKFSPDTCQNSGSSTSLLDTQTTEKPAIGVWSRLVEITGGLSVNWADEQKERKKEREGERKRNVTSVGGSQLAHSADTRVDFTRAAFLAFSFATILSLATST